MKKFKKVLLEVSLAVLSGTLVTGLCEGANYDAISVKAAEEPADNFEAYPNEPTWYQVDSYSYPAYDANTDTGYLNGRADLELYFSPIFADYKNFNKDSVKELLDKDNGLIGAIKKILASQVKFIQPVEQGAARTVDEQISTIYGIDKENVFDPDSHGGTTIFSEFVDAVIETINEDTEKNFTEEYENYRDTMNQESSLYRAVLDQIESGDSISSSFDDIMMFLRQILAYVAGTSLSEQTDFLDIRDEIADRIGADDPDGGLSSGLGQALAKIYTEAGQTNFDELIKGDIQMIFNDACDIAKGETQELALIEAFVLLEKTEIPMDVIVDIIGPEPIKEMVKDVFRDENISVEVARFLLEHFTKNTIYTLCQEVKFTKDEIKEAIEDVDPQRLMEIARDLSPEALDVIRIILGMANDNTDQGSPSALPKRSEGAHYTWNGQYNEFGNDLVNTVLNNMDLMDMINAVEAVWIGATPNDSNLLYSYNYTPAIGEVERAGRRLYLHNLIDFINNELPKMSEIATRADNDQKETFHITVKTPLNQEKIYCDFTIGFMPFKNCDDVRRLAKNLDDVFDLTFDFVEGENKDYSKNTLDYDLTIRPQYLTNLFELVFNGDTLINDEDLRLKEHLFDLMFNKTFGELKQYYNQNLAEELVKDLKHVNYETIIKTLLDFNNLKDIFKNTSYTEADITKFVSNLQWWMEKHGGITFEYLQSALLDVAGSQIASKINDQAFKDLVSDIYAWCNETDAANISIDVLKALTNSEVYTFVDLLDSGDKEDTLNRIANLIFRIVNTIPDELDNKKIMDYYADGKFEITETYNLDWEELLAPLPLGNKLFTVLNAMIEDEDDLVIGDGHVLIDGNTSLHTDSASVHSVTYKYEENGNQVVLKGMLPEGATLLDFAKDVIDGKEVDHWIVAEGDNKGATLLTMPDYDVVLSPVFKEGYSENLPTFIIVIFGLINIAALCVWFIATLSKEDKDEIVEEVETVKTRITTATSNVVKKIKSKVAKKSDDKKAKELAAKKIAEEKAEADKQAKELAAKKAAEEKAKAEAEKKAKELAAKKAAEEKAQAEAEKKATEEKAKKDDKKKSVEVAAPKKRGRPAKKTADDKPVETTAAKKRGRPAKKVSESKPVETVAPKKRGRPAKKVTEDKPTEVVEPKKRGRPAKKVTEDKPTEVVAPKKRGRPAKKVEEAKPVETATPKKRGRPAKKVVEPTTVAAPKKRGRPAKKVSESKPAETVAPKKRGRPAKKVVEPTTAAAPKKRGRPAKKVNESTPVLSAPKKRGRPAKKVTEVKPVTSAPKKRGRPAKNVAENKPVELVAPKKRGRPVKKVAEVKPIVTTAPKKRGRPAKKTEAVSKPVVAVKPVVKKTAAKPKVAAKPAQVKPVIEKPEVAVKPAVIAPKATPVEKPAEIKPQPKVNFHKRGSFKKEKAAARPVFNIRSKIK